MRVGAQKGHTKAGGRVKGTPNNSTVEIKELARIHGPAVITRLVELVNDASGAVAVAASRELLDRGYGKPPQSVGQSGHWLRFAQDVSKRDRNDLDRDVKLFFTVANVAFDAFIAAWHAKRVYDTSRPWTLVRYYYKGRKIRGWLGPGQGVGELPAEEWHPYSPFSFVTPPFPGYVSGHSTVSGACARVLALFISARGNCAYLKPC